MDNKEYKFQWSSKGDGGEILVVRGNDWETFMADIATAKGWIEKDPEWMDDVEVDLNKKYEGKTMDEVDPADLDDSFCSVHKEKMKERDGKNGKFFSHARQLEDESWDYCSGRGWKSEK